MTIDILNSIFVPIAIIFGIIEWVIIFLENYRHFPRMEKWKRIRNSICDATIMTVIMMCIVYFFMYILFQSL
jgi:hypothetical protein